MNNYEEKNQNLNDFIGNLGKISIGLIPFLTINNAISNLTYARLPDSVTITLLILIGTITSVSMFFIAFNTKGIIYCILSSILSAIIFAYFIMLSFYTYIDNTCKAKINAGSNTAIENCKKYNNNSGKQ